MFCRVCDTSQNYSNEINLIAFIFDVFCFTNYPVEFLSEGILQIEQLCKKFNSPNIGGCLKSIDLPLRVKDIKFENLSLSRGHPVEIIIESLNALYAEVYEVSK